MAGVKFSRKEFEKHFKISDEVKEKISLMKTHFEGMTEEEIELEITPDRPDLYSLQGFLRAFSAFSGKTKGLKEYSLHKGGKDYSVKIDKNLKDIRPFTACAIVRNLKFDDSKIKEIIDIQEKLHNTLGRNRKKIAIGIYPLEKISLPIKFEARKPREIKFIPLEMNREMDGLQILQQHSTGRAYAHLLEGMDKYPVFVDAKGKILSMPPIINSHETGKITETTKDIFIECSGQDFSILKKTLNILTSMLADMGGEIYSMTLDYNGKKEVTPDFTPEKMRLNIDNANNLLGLKLKEGEIKNLLEKMGYNYSKGVVEIPAYRTDIMHEVDIIEDIAIAYGYNNMIPEIPSIATIGEIDSEEVLKRKTAEILAGLGFLECSSYHLLTKEDLDKYNMKAIEVLDSKSDYKYLKPNLSVSLLKILSENIDSEYPQKIFEIGTCFEHGDTETGIKERKRLAIALTPGNFTEMKQILDYLGRMLSIDFKIEEGKGKDFIEGRTAKIMFAGREIGTFGEVHPSVLKTWHLKMPLVLLEVDI